MGKILSHHHFHHHHPSSTPGSGRSPGEGKGYPLQYSCLENSHGQRSLVGYSPQGRKELDTTEWLTLSLFKVVYNAAFYMHPSISDLKQDYEIYVFIILFYRWENWGDRRSSFSLKVTELGRWHGQDVFEPEVSYGLKPLHFSPADLWCLKSPHKCWLLGSIERERREGWRWHPILGCMGCWKNVSINKLIGMKGIICAPRHTGVLC